MQPWEIVKLELGLEFVHFIPSVWPIEREPVKEAIKEAEGEKELVLVV